MNPPIVTKLIYLNLFTAIYLSCLWIIVLFRLVHHFADVILNVILKFENLQMATTRVAILRFLPRVFLVDLRGHQVPGQWTGWTDGLKFKV